jgi:hypothetical protein
MDKVEFVLRTGSQCREPTQFTFRCLLTLKSKAEVALAKMACCGEALTTISTTS